MYSTQIVGAAPVPLLGIASCSLRLLLPSAPLMPAMAIEPAAGAVVAPRRQYSMADVLQLRSGAACNLSLEEAGIVTEPATQIIFRGASQWQKAPAGSPGHHHHPRRSNGEAPAPQHQRQGGPGAAAGHRPLPVVMGGGAEEEEWGDAEEDSEDENPQYKAFHVSGQPDFSIEEPDAEEYLRRVRWEAQRCPRVVVAPAHERPPAAPEQTPYMPALPGVTACAPHLLPSSEWEACFLADFSDLRTELVRLLDLLEEADAAALSSLPSSAAAIPSVRDASAWKRFCLGPSPGPQPAEGLASQREGGPQEGQPGEGSGCSGAVEGSGNEGGAQKERDAGREESFEGTACQTLDEREGVQSLSQEEEGRGGVHGEGLDGGGAQEAGPTKELAVQGGASPDERDTERVQVTAGADGGTPGHHTGENGSWQTGSGSSGDPQRGSPRAGSPAATGSGKAGLRETQGGGGMEDSGSLGAEPPSEVGTAKDGAAANADSQGGDITTTSPPVRRARRREALLEGVLPFLGILLRLDQVALAVHLRHHVRWLQELPPSAALDRRRGAWLFALCATVGKPLDPDTQAALRDLLRTAALRRANKVSPGDPELAVLNMLIAIAGRYFGQQER
ncbi:Survival motor neuron interacting protein [Klebsormidium nitens]|uniref:Survival motor neuron interacting protein n=1 Tax=Klebsormidium nitens TaxID=105231 RepID=A0A1Y1I8B8_KLENI|nr:Survival motor neuron interacting protein [Klebsormidium nitens]|eukprot:GAQ87224.1 Survival motor neuron interacting protein [Klebsormidium nitens]